MQNSQSTLELTQALVAIPSITPNDAGCQKMISTYLTTLGFNIETFQDGEVTNLWARRGNKSPLFAFVGHTDVVPTGPQQQWTTPPFEPHIREGYLYGRGVADMKCSIAAMLTAVNRFIQQHEQHAGSIAFLITSDEEGVATHGTIKIVERLEQRNEKIDWCIVGEPSSVEQVGDMIKNGRRGSLSFKLTVIGKQGHIAYPQLAKNPIHSCAPALAELTHTIWDQGAPYFQPTSFQISNINAGTGATNIIPGTVEILGNFRYSPALTVDDIQEKVLAVFNKHHVEFNIDWTHGAKPFLTAEGQLFDACRVAIKDATGLTTKLSTDGGTSDGRFIAPTGAQIIELGVCNNTIHQINECARIEDIEKLSEIYEGILKRLLS